MTGWDFIFRKFILLEPWLETNKLKHNAFRTQLGHSTANLPDSVAVHYPLDLSLLLVVYYLLKQTSKQIILRDEFRCFAEI